MQQFGHGAVWVPADGRVERPEQAARSAAFFCADSVAAFPTKHQKRLHPSINQDD